MKTRSIALGVAVATLFSASSLAADIPAPVAAVPTAAAVPQPTFNWNRTYVGVYGGVWLDIPGFTFDTVRIGAQAGRNFVLGDHFAVGLEATAGVYDFAGITFEAYATARAGFLLSRAFLYASASVGWDASFGLAYMFGGGVEFALTDNLAFRTDAQIWAEAGTPFDYVTLTGGLNWYLGN